MRCVDSVLAQSYKDIEVVVVNDGSTDSSGALLKRHYSHDPNVIVVSQANGGLSSARNAGLKASTGAYIAFLDSDDYVAPEMYGVLISNLEEYGADISSCASRDVLEDGTEINIKKHDRKIRVFDTSGSFMGLESKRHVRFEVWNKVYKRQLIGDIEFKVGQIYEDVYFEGQLFFKMNKMVHLDYPLHYYLMSREGNTGGSFSDKHMEALYEFIELIKRLERADMHNESKAIKIRACLFMLSLYGTAFRNKRYGHCRKIHDIFCEVYSLCSNHKSPKLTIFKLAPVFFVYMSRIRVLIKRRLST